MGGIFNVQNLLSLPQNAARDIGSLVVIKLLPDVWAEECRPLLQKVEELGFCWICLPTPYLLLYQRQGLKHLTDLQTVGIDCCVNTTASSISSALAD